MRSTILVAMTIAMASSGTWAAEGPSPAVAEKEKKSPMITIVPFADRQRSLKEQGIDDFELAGKVAAIMAAPAPADWKPSGMTREAYLDMAERIVRMAAAWVDEEGRVIDPVVGKEVGQTSPRFASPGAVLLAFGRVDDLRPVIYRTMDYCCRTLPSGEARRNSPDFWMRELATAYLALRSVADEKDLKRWAAGLSAVEPEKIYTRVDPEGKDIAGLANWALYAAGGEAMREAAGLRPDREMLWGSAFYDKYVGGQFSLFTANGMYRDPHDPLTYDITTRLQVASGLAFGYQGKLREPVEELLRRGGLTLLLFASPEGYCPYGGRSAAFNFREAIIAALCELEARRYKETNPPLAGAFKRQAHLSARSAERWLRMEPLRHIKNGFDPRLRHGIDTYGNYSVYSLLAASFLSLAAVYADDSIAEAPCPAEKGGFVFELAPAFHKVFANCQGAYLEIDTAADGRYDATGLGRFAVSGVPLELGLGAPFAAKGRQNFLVAEGTQPPVEQTAIGPAWQQDGHWMPLAALGEKDLRHTLKVIGESAEKVEFQIDYAAPQAKLAQHYRLEKGQVTIRTAVRQRPADGGDSWQPADRLRFIIPLLVSDGTQESRIEQAPGRVRVSYLGHQYDILTPPAATATLDEEIYVNRMGKYRSLIIEQPGAELEVTLQLK